MDIYICETHDKDAEYIKNMCIRYEIQKNVESNIWKILTFDQLKKRLNDEELLNVFMLCVDSKMAGYGEYIVKCNNENYIILLVSDPRQLLSWVSPTVRPSGIIEKPVKEELLKPLLDEIWNDYNWAGDFEDQFSFNIKAEKYVVPCSKILYFESRSKKIVIRTFNQEFEFYDTMANIMDGLPPSFIRVHRSFIINGKLITSVDFGDNTIYLNEDTFVPLSRSFKSILQKYLGDV